MMPSGGARNRSGPQANPSSLRTAERGLAYTKLPSEGFKGRAPAWPLTRASKRETEVWRWAWKTPQAAAWKLETWRWPVIGMWVRTFVICEGRDATAADKGSLHRFADQIGLTPAGLRENGWAIARDETAGRREAKAAPKARPSARDRLTVVNGDGS